MTTEKKSYIGFGIVGCGMIADIHAQALCSIPEVRLIGVTDVSVASANAFAEKHGVRAYESYEQMLADENIDAVCICTPKESGKLLSVISQLRFAPDSIRLKNAVQNGSFGKIHFCNLSMKYWRDETYYSGSRWKGSRLLDGGILMNQGIHGIDLLHHVMGDIEVTGSVTDRLHHKLEAPDTALALLRYECGALGVLESTTAAYPGFDLKLEIIGTKGYAVFTEDHFSTFILDGVEQELLPETKSSGTASDPKAVGWKKHALQLKNFADAINGIAPLAVRGEDGRAAVALISAVYQENT